MKVIICPHCKKEFTLSADEYTEIVNQIRNQEFKSELEEREKNILNRISAESKAKMIEELSKKDMEIQNIVHEKELLEKSFDDRVELEKNKIQHNMSGTISKLQSEIQRLENEASIKLIEHSNEIKDKEAEISYYKDLKTRMSTKLLGETLEQHCSNVFNQFRTSAFPNAFFEKDNSASKESGSKGDFIFRDYSDNQEYISIMFELL